jgi:hypothetical protein
MFWPIYIYLIMSVTIAGSATYHVGWSAGLRAIAVSFLFLVAGGGLKASLWWGDKAQKIGGCVVAVLLAALAQWLSSGFSVQLFGHPLSGRLWGWIGFAVCFVFANKKLAEPETWTPKSKAVVSGQSSANLQAALTREKIIKEYGALMERTPPLPTRIEDVSALPHPKEAILDALLQEIVRGHPQHISDAMSAGAISLAQYQPGVGNDPLEMLGVDVAKLQLPNERDVEAVRAQAKLITETESKTRERFHEFNELVIEDVKRINRMIAAAEALGQKMPEEQKKRVLG